MVRFTIFFYFILTAIVFVPLGNAGNARLQVKIHDVREPYVVRVTAIETVFLAARHAQISSKFGFDLPAPGYYVVEVQFHSGLELCRTVLVGKGKPEAQELKVSPADAYDARDLMEAAHTVSPEVLGAGDRLLSAMEKFEKALESGNAERAEEILNGVVERSPEVALAWNNLGAMRVQQRRTEEAMKLLAHARELDPDAFEVNLNLGRTFHMSGAYEAAVRHARQCLEQRPHHPNALALAANALFLLKRPQEARPYYEELLRVDPSHVTFPDLYLAWMDQEAGDLESAAQRVLEWAQKHPRHPHRADYVRKAKAALVDQISQRRMEKTEGARAESASPSRGVAMAGTFAAQQD